MLLLRLWDRSSGGHHGISERSDCSPSILCRWDKAQIDILYILLLQSSLCGQRSGVFLLLMCALVLGSPRCFTSLSSRGVPSKLVTKCLLTLKPRLLPLSVDCLCETFFHDYVKSV